MKMRLEKVPFVWHENKRDNVWKYGSDNDGMSVFCEPDGSWHGNIMILGYNTAIGVGPYDTIIKVMRECEIMYLRLKSLHT